LKLPETQHRTSPKSIAGKFDDPRLSFKSHPFHSSTKAAAMEACRSVFVVGQTLEQDEDMEVADLGLC